MEIETFEFQLQQIRATNGWKFEIEMPGIFIINVYDKESGDFLAKTGCTSLFGILWALQLGLDHEIWSKDQNMHNPSKEIVAEIKRIEPLINTSDTYYGPYRNGLQFALERL